jgi:hypothetical protein
MGLIQYTKSTLEEYNKCREDKTGYTQIINEYKGCGKQRLVYKCDYCKERVQKKDIHWYYYLKQVTKSVRNKRKIIESKRFLTFCNELHFNLYVLSRLS